MSKRKRGRRRKPCRSSRPSARSSSSEYRQAVCKADQVLSINDIEIRSDNWQRLALGWFAPDEPDRSEMARYIAAHKRQLGVAWARELLRLEVLFRAEEHLQIIAHYDCALSQYPRCAFAEMWVADQVSRHAGDFWRARQMYRYVADNLPGYAKPRYELGFMSYLLGDFRGALDWFNQAAELVADADVELGSRIFHNRGMVRFYLEGNRKAAIADVKEALRRRPDYPQAKEALRGLRGKVRWVPW